MRGLRLHPLSLCLCPQGQADAEDAEGKHRPLSPPCAACAEPLPCLLLFPRRSPAQFFPGCCSRTSPRCCRPPCGGVGPGYSRASPPPAHAGAEPLPFQSRLRGRWVLLGGAGGVWVFFFSWLFNGNPWKSSRGKFRRLVGARACLWGMEQPSLVLCTGGRAGRGGSSGLLRLFLAPSGTSNRGITPFGKALKAHRVQQFLQHCQGHR